MGTWIYPFGRWWLLSVSIRSLHTCVRGFRTEFDLHFVGEATGGFRWTKNIEQSIFFDLINQYHSFLNNEESHPHHHPKPSPSHTSPSQIRPKKKSPRHNNKTHTAPKTRNKENPVWAWEQNRKRLLLSTLSFLSEYTYTHSLRLPLLLFWTYYKTIGMGMGINSIMSLCSSREPD